MIDYDLYYRSHINPENLSKIDDIDIFISAFNRSKRIEIVYENIKSIKKYWFIQPEYNFNYDDIKNLNDVIISDSFHETFQVKRIIDTFKESFGDNFSEKKIVIDCTGFMRHTLAFLVIKLAALKCSNVEIIYTEPKTYINNDRTKFSELCDEVRPIGGTEFTKTGSKEAAIMSIGYDTELMSQMLNSYEGVKLFPLFSFPSLSADMFQHSVLQSVNIQSPHKSIINSTRYFAAAHDPFSTAKEISKLVSIISNEQYTKNIYLVPLSTKAQVIGHVFFWWKEHKKLKEKDININITLPIPKAYKSVTSKGIGRIWKYTLEL
ncbi:hypothetical protein ABLU22_15010 [Acinetobacter lwoffii]|nr:hypothetical protein [Acinetobacter lwoffii]ENW25546.1 hypothetical protein F925_00890 [Acinetobacter lwoffii NCTC 5866 = CIP 64.10 = NIPH 512]QZM12319.1 hypothetical protein ABVS_1649 [Acinetobacter lwoffii]